MPHIFDWQHLPLHARLVSAFRMGIPAGCLPSTLTRQCLAACRTLLVCLGLMLCSSYALAQPTVSSVIPSSGPTSGGTSIIISGSNFSGTTAVNFGATPATGVTVDSPTQITATAPAGAAGTVDITVTTAGGTSVTNAADQYTYVAAPTVTSMSPTSGPATGGTTVTITGTNFSGARAVTFGGTMASGYTVNSTTQITATAPAGTGTVDVRVITAGGTSATSAADQYTYVAAPTVTSMSPTSGSATGGTTVIITGTNFSGARAVTFGGTAASGYTVNSATQITAKAPAGTGTVDVRVTTAGGTSATSAADQFTYTSLPTLSINDISMPEGDSGSTQMTFTVTLSAASASAVTVNYASSNGTAIAGADYIAVSDTLTFAAGQTSKTLSVPILGDTVVEPHETFYITLSNPSNATLTKATGTGTIPDDDTAAITIADVSLPEGNAGTSVMTFTATLDKAVSGGFTVNYATADGTATTADNDYVAATGTLTFAGTAGETRTFTVTVNGDTRVEANETFTVSLNTVSNAAISITDTAVGTILNDDQVVLPPVASPFTHTAPYNAGTAPAITFSVISHVTNTPISYAVGSASTTQGGSVSISNTGLVTYTAPVGFNGTDLFTYTATNAGGTSMPATVSITIAADVPAVPSVSVSTGPNQPVTINATANAIGAPFTGLVVHTQPASGSVAVQGMNLVYTPAASTQGAISFAYTLANVGGTSAPITVTVQVAARPDPTANADVRGLSTAQQQATVRFAGAQLLNFTQRLEQLRNPQQRQAFQNGLQLAMPRAGNNSIRNCQNVPSMLGQQDCIARQGMDSGSALAPRWGHTAQQDALPGADGLSAEQAYVSRLDSETANAPATLGSTQRNLAQRAVALGAGTTARNTRVNADEPLPEPGSAERPRLAYWTAGMLDWGFADASKGQDDGLRFTTSGVTMGLDYLVNAQWTVGMGMGFAYDRTTIGSEGSSNHSKGVSTALYGSWSPAPAYFVDGVLGYSRLRFDSRRWVADAGEFAQGERDGSQWFASVSAGYEWRTQQMLLSPYGRLQWARSSLDAYTETGAGWHALQFGEQRITSTSASLGLRGETNHDTRWGQLMPFGRLELQHDFDHQSDVRIAYADLNGSQGYAISSSPIGRNRVQVGFGSRLQSRMGTFSAELQFTRSNTSFQRGLRLLYTTRY